MRQRRRVHQMRPPDQHDVGKGAAALGERVAQLGDGRQQPARDRLDRGDVHDRRERVVRRLAAVDVVVRVDALRSAPPAI